MRLNRFQSESINGGRIKLSHTQNAARPQSRIGIGNFMAGGILCMIIATFSTPIILYLSHILK